MLHAWVETCPAPRFDREESRAWIRRMQHAHRHRARSSETDQAEGRRMPLREVFRVQLEEC